MEIPDKIKEQVSSKAKSVKEVAAAQAKLVQKAAVAQAGVARDAAAAQARVVLSDLWQALRTERTFQIMVAMLVVCVACWDMPYVSVILYPFKLFVTMIHEACHALVARATGGNVAFIAINPDESGYTGSLGGLRPLVVMAGYLGTAFFGGLMIWWGRNPAEARFVLQTIGCVLLSLTVFYGGGGWFSVVSMLVIAGLIVLISRKASAYVCHMFLLMLAVITTLQGLVNIQDLFLVSALTSGPSDGKSMEELTGVPAVVWSILWGLISLAVLIFAFWISYRPSRVSRSGQGSVVTNSNEVESPVGSAVEPGIASSNVGES